MSQPKPLVLIAYESLGVKGGGLSPVLSRRLNSYQPIGAPVALHDHSFDMPQLVDRAIPASLDVMPSFPGGLAAATSD